jgi:hypothetical protein
MGGGVNGASPVITDVSWEAAPDCVSGESSNVTITVTATDPDTSAGNLTYNGSVSGCTGAIDAAVSGINCPNVAPYPGAVIVSDSDGNDSTPVSFTVGVCTSDSCTGNPSSCRF